MQGMSDFSTTEKLRSWEPDSGLLRITTIDCHTEGEPLRVVTGGIPELPGDSILERRRYMERELDHLRRILMWEPRGHADMYGCIVTRPVGQDSDFGVLFIHNDGYSTMCGHGIIGVATVAAEAGLTQGKSLLKIDTPAGLVTAEVHETDSGANMVSFLNVPSFVVALDQTVDVPGIGEVQFDVAFGGAYYAFVDAPSVGLHCTPEYFSQLIDVGMKIKRSVSSTISIEHPREQDLSFLYGTIFTEDSVGPMLGRHVCVFANGEVDRSPTGTGVSARAAILSARKQLAVGREISISSIVGSSFVVQVVEETSYHGIAAVIPEVRGSAYITGRHEFLADVRDPLREGFLLR